MGYWWWRVSGPWRWIIFPSDFCPGVRRIYPGRPGIRVGCYRHYFKQKVTEIELMSHWCRQHAGDIWGYCLMPNHIHLIAVPSDMDILRRAVGEAHRRYTRRVKALKAGPKPKAGN